MGRKYKCLCGASLTATVKNLGDQKEFSCPICGKRYEAEKSRKRDLWKITFIGGATQKSTSMTAIN